MLTNKGLNITVSQGDTANFLLNLRDFVLKATDVIRFSLKSYGSGCCCNRILTKAVTGLTGNKVYISIPSALTRSLPAQTFIYDLVVMDGNNVTTLNLPAKFKVVGTAHSMDNLPMNLDGMTISTVGMNSDAPEISIDVPPDWGRLPDFDALINDVAVENDELIFKRVGGGQIDNILEAVTTDELDELFGEEEEETPAAEYCCEEASTGQIDDVFGG